MVQNGYYKRNNGSEAIIEVVGIHESGDYLCVWIFNSSEKPFRYHSYDFEKEFESISIKEVKKLERQRCPRRGEGAMMFEKEPLPDYWRVLPNGDKTCSFCGSLHPDSIIEIVKTSGFGVIERSDKSYKWYIHRPTIKNALEGGIKYYRQHDTPEFINKFNELVSSSKQ